MPQGAFRLPCAIYYGWKAHPQGKKLGQDTLTRISLLIGIFKALHILYSEKLADAWVTVWVPIPAE